MNYRTGHNPPASLLGQRLIAQHLLTTIELNLALLEQQDHPRLLGDILLTLNFIDETSLVEILAKQLGIPAHDPTNTVPKPEILRLFSPDFIRSEQFLPLDLIDIQDKPTLHIALAQPQDLVKLDQIRHQLPHNWEISPCLAGKKTLSLAIDRLLGLAHSKVPDLLAGIQQVAESAQHGHHIIPLVDELLAEAIEQGASDIHFEPDQNILKIRIRVDGLLRTQHVLRAHLWPSLLVRLKLLTEMDISDTRHPQDGRMTVERPARTIDIRASTLPTMHGENLVLRLLDRNKGIRPLSALGLPPEQLALLHQLLDTPEGLLLVIGPTGSGKTTTLYAMLRHLQNDSLHIMTLEDPVEYALPGIRQTAIDPPRLDFADGIRAMLRQDPDILLVGEIRDEATAAMTLRAAQTGHRIFSTLHASSPFAALPRLQQLKLPLAALRGNLTGIVSQRLLRALCPLCSTEYKANTAELKQLGRESSKLTILRKPLGCASCDGTGYRGQIPLMEILPFSADMEMLLTDQAALDHSSIVHLARKTGWQSLAEHGKQRVLKGETSLSELCRTVSLNPLSTEVRN